MKSNIKNNIIYQICYQILIIILPFITSPYISRILGAENIGIYTYTFTIVYYFTMFANLGIEKYGNRRIAQVRNNKKDLDKEFSSIFYLHISITLVIYIFYILYILLVDSEYKLYLIIQGFTLIGTGFDINWFFFGIEKFKLTVTRNSILKIITVISIFIFVNDINDLWIYTLIMSFSFCITQIITWPFIGRYTKFVRVQIYDIIKHIKPMMVLFAAVVAMSVFSYMDKLMLGSMSNMSQLGFYDNALKIVQFPTSLITALGTVMLPVMTNVYVNRDDNLAFKYINNAMIFSLYIGCAISFGVAAVSTNFSIVFWGEEFMACGTIVKILSITVILMSWNGVIRTQYLIPKGMDKSYLLAVSMGAIMNLVSNYLLIPSYGAIGASIGTVIAYFTIFIVQNISASKILPINKYIKEVIPFIIMATIMFIIVILIENIFINSTLSLITQIITGVIVYIFISIIYFKKTNNELTLGIVRTLKYKYIRNKL